MAFRQKLLNLDDPLRKRFSDCIADLKRNFQMMRGAHWLEPNQTHARRALRDGLLTCPILFRACLSDCRGRPDTRHR